MTENRTERGYAAALRKAGVRITRQRRLVLRLLAEASDHPDAMELHRRAVAEASGGLEHGRRPPVRVDGFPATCGAVVHGGESPDRDPSALTGS